MYFHSVGYDIVADIVAIATEPDEASVVFLNDETVKHLLNVGHNSNWFLSEAEHNSYKVVALIKPNDKDVE